MKTFTKYRIVLYLCCAVFSATFFFYFGNDSAAQTKPSKVNPTPSPVDKTRKTPLSAKVSLDKIKLGDSEIEVSVSTTAKPKPLYFRPHENEETASQAMTEILKKHGGTFVELRSKGKRTINFMLGRKTFKFDPNRIFSTAGIEETLGESRTKAAVETVSGFVKILLSKYLTDKNLLIAVHNNTDLGSISVETYKADKDATKVFQNPKRDPDDFFFVTEEKFFNALKKKGFNVVLQDNEKVFDDGSLSVYCGKKGIPYINVESEHGHLTQQIEMLAAIQEIIKNAE